MAATEPVRVYSQTKRDYEKNRENSGIYKSKKKDIPVFKNNRYCIEKSTKAFYSELMLCVNHIYTLDDDKYEDAVTCYFILLLDRLVTSDKHYNVSIKVKKGDKNEKIVPKPVRELQDELDRLADIVLEKEKPVLDEGQKKDLSYLKSLLPAVLKRLVNDKYKDHIKKTIKFDLNILTSVMTGNRKIRQRLAESFKKTDLKKITDNVTECYIHNSIKGDIYNATSRVKNGVEMGPRNKTIAMLDELAREMNFDEVYDYVAYTDKETVYKMYDELKDVNDPLIFIPIASDCFGNIVAMANKYRLTYSCVTKESKHEVFFVVIKHKNEKKVGSNLQINLRSVYEGKDVYLSYDTALDHLRLETSKYLESLSELNGNYFKILKKYKYKELPDLTGIAESNDFEKELEKNKRKLAKEMENQ